MFNIISLRLLRTLAPLALVMTVASAASAQSTSNNAYDLGTPAEQRSGVSSLSTYHEDKVETVNLANGNLTVHIPLVTVGGRGSAAYTVALNYNSKLWAGDHQTEDLTGPFGPPDIRHHYAALADDGLMGRPNLLVIGAGWSICKAPAIRVRRIGIDPTNLKPPSNEFIYALTKVWLTLPDGSEVELRDSQWEGEPLVIPSSAGGIFDGNRGRVWHSTDGSAITYITDAANGAVLGQLSGVVFLADGTRLIMTGALGGSARCTSIIDRNGNEVNIQYDTPQTGDVTYTDQLNRQVVLHELQDSSFNVVGATVTIKGYGTVADRVFTVDVGSVEDNLRSDFANIQKPIINGDINFDTGGGHVIQQPHTDLFLLNGGPGSDFFNGIVYMSEVPAVTTLHLLDGRTFKFQYDPFGELAQVTYPAGGVSKIEYAAFGSSLCEGGNALNGFLNRGVTDRRNLTDGVNADAHWKYARTSGQVGAVTYPAVQVTATQGESGTTLVSELHYFLALDAEYRFCGSTGASNGTGYQLFENARELRVDKQTGSGTQSDQKTWQQRAPLAWQQDPTNPTISYVNPNASVPGHGQQNPPNDPRVIQEDTTLEDGKVKRVTTGYDQFNNETSIAETDFGPGAPGLIRRQTARTYLTNQNTYCYTNLNGLDNTCGSAIATSYDNIIHMRRLVLSETISDGGGNLEAETDLEYDNYDPTVTSHAAIVTNTGMTGYSDRFSAFAAKSQPRGNETKITHKIDASHSAIHFGQYDNAGDLLKHIDPSGNATAYSYADNFGDGTFSSVGAAPNGPTFAMPTTVKNALNQTTSYQFDYTRTMPVGVKDLNGIITQTAYEVYDRPVTVTAALFKPEQAITQFTYESPGSDIATTSRQLDSSRWLSSQTVYDGFERAVKASHNEDGLPAGSANFSISTSTIYDGLGRAVKVSNPYRSTAASTDGWTRTAYDLAGRAVEVASFAGGPSSPPPDSGTNASWTGSVVTAYNGEVTTVHDQANKQKRSTTDGLGRLIKVEEMEEYPSTTVYATTTYGYDARGNLKTVSQPGPESRTFVYDNLSRLTDATNPETGTFANM
jgi:YD repeat-containing protein